MTACPEEELPQHPNSPGPVTGDEVVCRGAYHPIHFSKSGALKSALVRPAHLIAGELSVWRLERDPAFDLGAVIAKLEEVAGEGQSLRQVQGASAGSVRAIRLPELLPPDQRVFCVLDDCRTDDEGGWHPEHATITLEKIAGVTWAVGTDPFDTAKEGLATILKRQTLWQAAA